MGQIEIFKEIWEERDHVSEVSGRPLPYPGHLQWHWCFSHILPKGIYKKAELSKENIILLTPYEHDQYGNHSYNVRNLREWKWVFDRYDELKAKYHAGYFG